MKLSIISALFFFLPATSFAGEVDETVAWVSLATSLISLLAAILGLIQVSLSKLPKDILLFLLALRKNEKEKGYSTIIESVLKDRFRKGYRANLFLILSSFIILYLSLTGSLNINYVFIPIFMILMVYLSHWVIGYRLKMGFYGNNYYEAREILKFIDEHYNKDDFFDGDQLKKLFPKLEIKDSRSFDINGVRT